jgi:hypothetical protein
MSRRCIVDEAGTEWRDIRRGREVPEAHRVDRPSSGTSAAPSLVPSPGTRPTPAILHRLDVAGTRPEAADPPGASPPRALRRNSTSNGGGIFTEIKGLTDNLPRI